MTDLSDIMKALPPFLSEVARLTSAEVALKIAAAWGGTAVRVPGRKVEGSKLAELVGEENARIIVASYGGNEIPIPRAASINLKKAAILQSSDSANETARKLGCTERHVRRVRNACGMRGDGPNGMQPSVFEKRILNTQGNAEEVAEALDLPVNIVRAVRGKFGMARQQDEGAPKKKKPWKPEHPTPLQERILKMDGEAADVAEALGCSRDTVYAARSMWKKGGPQ